MLEKNKRNASVMMLMATACIAASFPVSQSLMQYIPAELALLLRFIVSSILFYAFILVKGLRIPLIPKKWKAYLFVSFFYALFFVCTFASLKLTSPFNTSVIYTLMPSISLLISWFVFRDTKIKRYLVPLLLSTLASIIVITQGKGTLSAMLASANIGDWIFLLGTGCMACFFNLTKKYTAEDIPLVSTFYVLLGNTVWMLLYFLIFSHSLLFVIKPIAIVELAFLIVFCTVLTFFSMQYAARWITPIKISSFSYLTPIGIVLINASIFSMKINAIAVFASIISVLSLVYIQCFPGKQRGLVK